MLSLDGLNEDQKQAVCHTNGPLLVLAGAGTGKTTVITYKIAYLLERGIYNPHNILAVTFTNKAADQMQQRVERLCGKRLPYIGTFHSVALKILRVHADLVGLKNDLAVLDYADQIKMMKNIYIDHKLDNNKLDHKLAHYLITTWKDLNLMPEDVDDQNKLAISIYQHYQHYLRKSNLVDFSDILLYVNYIFTKYQDVRELYKDRFKYVLVDEYQDTNKAQYDWIKLIAAEHKNLCCVGDDDQSIYSWRGAQISNILNFGQEFPGTKIITLSQNYRSTQNILDVAQSIIANNESRYGKKLVSGRHDVIDKDIPVKLVECNNTNEEAEFIVQELPRLPKDYVAAVLVRTNFQTRILEDAFIHHKIPYVIIGSVKFYDLREVKDAVCYLRASINHTDDVAFERIINTPKRSIGQTTVANIRQYALNNNISLFESVKSLLEQGAFAKKAAAELASFINYLTQWQEYCKNLAPNTATQKILDESGYMSMLNKNLFELQRVENIKELLKAISEHKTIHEFIDYISLVNSRDGEDEATAAVKVMTVHAAKGLEFDAVFLPNWAEGVLPSPKALTDTNPTALEEERRIAYVGITRAKNVLYISYSTYAKTRENYFIPQDPSRFIGEISADLIFRERYPKIEYSFNNLLPGSRVSHKVFGYGLIIKSIDETKYEVGFKNHGIKLIHKDFLNIL